MTRLARSLVSDGRVTEIEARVFHAWLQRHPGVRGVAEVDRIVEILTDVFAEGRMGGEPRAELARLLAELGG